MNRSIIEFRTTAFWCLAARHIPAATGISAGKCFFERSAGKHGKICGNFDAPAREFYGCAAGISGIESGGHVCSVPDLLDSIFGPWASAGDARHPPERSYDDAARTTESKPGCGRPRNGQRGAGSAKMPIAGAREATRESGCGNSRSRHFPDHRFMAALRPSRPSSRLELIPKAVIRSRRGVRHKMVDSGMAVL